MNGPRVSLGNGRGVHRKVQPQSPNRQPRLPRCRKVFLWPLRRLMLRPRSPRIANEAVKEAAIAVATGVDAARVAEEMAAVVSRIRSTRRLDLTSVAPISEPNSA